MNEKENEGVKVTDKRRFGENGKPREDAEPKTSSAAEEPKTKENAGGKKKEERALPEIDFPTFILSLATSAQVHLGAIPNPQSGKEERDLALAKQTIDILGVLQAKTKGNLSNDEDRLLEHVLYDLRMMYVESNK